MGENAEDGIRSEPALLVQQHQQEREEEADRHGRKRQVERKQRAEADPEQGAVGERVAEVGHASPDHEAAERAGDHGDADAAQDRAHQEVIEHRCRFAPDRAVFRASSSDTATTSPARSCA